MASTKIAINGFGRIGRLALRAALESPKLEIVSVNDPGSIAELAHLLKYDSVYGILPHTIEVVDDTIVIDGKPIKVTHILNPEELPHRELEIDIVLECSGVFTDKEGASKHLTAGAKKVIISAPGKGVDATFCYGINHELFDPTEHIVVSNASCTTNCLAPIAKVLNDQFGIVKGTMTTIHAYTNDQKLTDATHKKDFRRARAANLSIIPTETGAAKAISLVLPELTGKLDGLALRTPLPTVSLVDLVVETEKPTSKEEVNQALITASETYLKNILGVSTDPVVSVDFKGDPRSSIADLPLTSVMQNNLVKVMSWYDNEWGYTVRLVDLTEYIADKM